jgi:hypothetical protein
LAERGSVCFVGRQPGLKPFPLAQLYMKARFFFQVRVELAPTDEHADAPCEFVQQVHDGPPLLLHAASLP